MRRKLLNGMIVLLVAICCPAAYISMVSAASFLGNERQLEQVDISIMHETPVRRGEPFRFTVRVKNLANERQVLDSIDIWNESISGVTISGSKPAYAITEHYFGLDSYVYELNIEPGETGRVELEATIGESGTIPLELDVCINQPDLCATFSAEIEVRP